MVLAPTFVVLATSVVVAISISATVVGPVFGFIRNGLVAVKRARRLELYLNEARQGVEVHEQLHRILEVLQCIEGEGHGKVKEIMLLVE